MERVMDSEISASRLTESQNLRLESLNEKDLGQNCFASINQKNHSLVSPSSKIVADSHRGDTLVPVTPDPDREGGDPLQVLASPSTTITPLSKPHCRFSQQVDDLPQPNDDADSPHTPKGGVFDPFAPGPDKLMLAPYIKRVVEQSPSYVARRLDFGSVLSGTEGEEDRRDGNSESASEEEVFVEAFFCSLLELFFSNQVEGSQVLPQGDGFKTPTSAPRLSGVAETCPGAPIKSRRKLMSIDSELCRKLDF